MGYEQTVGKDRAFISPTVTITSPTGGSVVSGTNTIAVNATDDDAVGTLNVEVSTDGGGTWTQAPWSPILRVNKKIHS